MIKNIKTLSKLQETKLLQKFKPRNKTKFLSDIRRQVRLNRSLNIQSKKDILTKNYSQGNTDVSRSLDRLLASKSNTSMSELKRINKLMGKMKKGASVKKIFGSRLYQNTFYKDTKQYVKNLQFKSKLISLNRSEFYFDNPSELQEYNRLYSNGKFQEADELWNSTQLKQSYASYKKRKGIGTLSSKQEAKLLSLLEL